MLLCNSTVCALKLHFSFFTVYQNQKGGDILAWTTKSLVSFQFSKRGKIPKHKIVHTCFITFSSLAFHLLNNMYSEEWLNLFKLNKIIISFIYIGLFILKGSHQTGMTSPPLKCNHLWSGIQQPINSAQQHYRTLQYRAGNKVKYCTQLQLS